MASLNSVRPLVPELILALAGIPGDLITAHVRVTAASAPNAPKQIANKGSDAEEEEEDLEAYHAIEKGDVAMQTLVYELSESVDLEPADRAVISELCELGKTFQEIQSFTLRHQNDANPNIDELDSDRSLYRSAFAAALLDLLDEYRDTLCQPLEEGDYNAPQNLSRSHTSNFALLRVYHRLAGFRALFPVVRSVVFEVDGGRLRGGEILSLLRRTAQSGIPIVKQTFERLLQRVQTVFFAQLSSWILYGLLNDPYKEFCIEIIARDGDENEKGNMVCDNLGVYGGLQSRAKDHQPEIWNRYGIRASMVPEYLSLPIVDKILFIGKAVQVLNSTIPSSPESSATSSSESLYLSPSSWRLTDSDVHTFASNLHHHSLSLSPLHLLSFEHTLDTIRKKIASNLKKLVVNQSNLRDHLEMIWNYSMLGKGDFWRECMEEYTNEGIRSSDEFSRQFQSAALRSTAEYDPYFHRVGIVLDDTDESNLSTWWTSVRLEYRIDWPVNLLLHKEVLRICNDIFRFLINVKRVQFLLQQAWRRLCRLQHSTHTHWAANPSLLLRLCALRSRMAFTADTLQFYLQRDVLDTQWRILLKEIEESQDFERIRGALGDFLQRVMEQCFLHTKVVLRGVEDIFSRCEQLATLILQLHSDISPASLETVDESVAVLAKHFDRQSHFLYTLLSGLKSPHLARLVTQLAPT